MNTVGNVSAGKPKVSGAIFRAPVGSTLPTAADDALDNAFVCLGYVSEDGVTNSTSMTSEDIRAWGGDIVYAAETGKEDRFQFKLIETLNVDVLKAVYRDDNVTGDLTTGITVNVNSKPQQEAAWVIDEVLRGNVARRRVIPNGKVTEIGDIVSVDDDVIGYEITVTATPDSNGNTHYEYLKK